MRGLFVLVIVAGLALAGACTKKAASTSAKSPAPGDKAGNGLKSTDDDGKPGGGGDGDGAPPPTGSDPCEGGETKSDPCEGGEKR